MCEFLRWNPEEEKYCSFEGGYVGRVSGKLVHSTRHSSSCVNDIDTLSSYCYVQWQAPEQIIHRRDLYDEKSDVFSLGYVLYFLLTGDQQWNSESSNRAASYAVRGTLPEIDPKIAESTHPFDVAVIAEIKRCLQYNPEDRPTAREVADSLHEALVNAGLAES